ncbi:hypothetical protein I553_3789 [Mycobacterium xenopi 4042]|uniref:Uncharacterized protein n=1 Tax=Mycobacterium xenopi 4042 TaxID=1299334 RepID=X8BEM4_MYCXE|nr:hypothetical protein I553_3789 [Mycobacterium xenopi 4042]
MAAAALAAMIDDAGLVPEITRTDEDTRWCARPSTPAAGDRRRVDRGRSRPYPRSGCRPRSCGLDAGSRCRDADRYLLGSTPRARHPFTAGVGADAGGDRTHLIGTRGSGPRCGSAVGDGYRAW